MTQEKKNDLIQNLVMVKDYLKIGMGNQVYIDTLDDILTELERAQRMQSALELCVSAMEDTEQYLQELNNTGVDGLDVAIYQAKQALSAVGEPTTIKPQYGEWLPIDENTPKDGETHVDLYCVSMSFLGQRVCDCFWSSNHKCWMQRGGFIPKNPTHWMPLPTPPTGESQKG